MKIDMTAKIYAGDQPMRDTGTNEEITLRTLCLGALGFLRPQEEMPDEQKIRCGKMAVESLSDEADWSIEDVALAQSRIKKRFDPILAYLGTELLEKGNG